VPRIGFRRINRIAMLDRFEHERNHGTHRTHGRKTAEDPLSFSVCSEYSVVKNLFGGQPPTALDRTTEHTEHTEGRLPRQQNLRVRFGLGKVSSSHLVNAS
jgi:hypothetical protein